MIKKPPKEFVLRTRWFTQAQLLAQATSKSGELCSLSGPRNPYGKVGVIKEGAMADLLLINGNPLKDVMILTKPEKHHALIMKDGRIYKNRLSK